MGRPRAARGGHYQSTRAAKAPGDRGPAPSRPGRRRSGKSRLGWTTEAFIELFCEGRTPPAVIRTTLSRYLEVVGAYTITGDPDALVHLRASDTAHLEATLERVRSEPFIVRTRSVIVLSRLIERQVPTQREPGTGTGGV